MRRMQCYNEHRVIVHFYCANHASAVLGIVILSVCPSVCLFVRLSVTRVLCNVTKERIAEIFTPHKRVINLALKLI